MPRDYREMLRDWRSQNRHPSTLPTVRNLAHGEVELFIYDVIGEDFWGDGVSAKDLVPRIHAIDADKILVRVNSPGGVITDAVAIRNALAEHPATIETHIDGAAYSAASWIGMAGEVIMHPQSSMFIHDGMTFAWGNEADLRAAADVVGTLSNQIADIYAGRTGGTRDEWRDHMRTEMFLTAEQAVEHGLADRVATDPAPENRKFEPTKRNAEKALRDAGFSRDDAKALLSGGSPRDVSDASDQLYAAFVAAPSREVTHV